MAIQAVLVSVPQIPGWGALGPEKQGWLLEHTANISKYRGMQAAGVIGECRELYLIQQGLAGEKLTMGAYLATMYGKSDRTAWNRLKHYRELTKVVPQEVIDALADNAEAFLSGTSGVGAADVIKAAKALPAPSSKEPKVIEGYIGDLRMKLREDRRRRRIGYRKLEPDEAMKQFVITCRRLLSAASLKTPAEQRDWLKTGLGYLMDERAITGTVTAQRTAIPHGWLPRPGRPKRAKKV